MQTEIIGGVLIGVIVIRVVEYLVTRYMSRMDQEYVTVEHCKRNMENVMRCSEELRARQLELRGRDLPEKYVQKLDFRAEIANLRDWMDSIEKKLDRLIERVHA